MSGPLFKVKYLEFNPFRYNHTLTPEVALTEMAIQEHEADAVVVMLQSIHTDLVRNQVPLDPDFERVLNANYWDLLV